MKSGTKINTVQRRFDQLLLDAIDEVLSSLGEPVRNHLYIHFENDFLISRNELTQRIEEFSDVLYRIFGSSAKHLEIRFIQTLYTKISVDQDVEDKSIVFKETDITFLNYVNRMRESFEISR